MKILAKIAAVYLIIWVLTGLHSRFVWNKDAPCYGKDVVEPRYVCTIFFDFGLNGMVWPYYWAGMFKLGSWAWLPKIGGDNDR